MLKHRITSRESITGFLTAAFGLAMLAGYDERFGVYLKAIFTIMTALGGLLFLGALALPSMRRTGLERFTAYELAFIVILVASPFLISWLGFWSASFMVIWAIAMLSPGSRTAASVVETTVYTALVTFATYLVFSVLLQIKVPDGILF